MSLRNSEFDDFVSGLPAAQRATQSTLVARIAQRAQAWPFIHDFLFIPGWDHPVWNDSENQVWRATQQLMLDSHPGEGEYPVAWIGYDSLNRLSRKRQIQGFMITNRRLIVKDDVDLIFGKAEARQYPFVVGPSGIAEAVATIVNSAVSSYDWDSAKEVIDSLDMQQFTGALSEFLTITIETLRHFGEEVSEKPATSSTLRGRVSELSLSSHAKYPDDPKQTKHFAKIAKKIPLDPGEEVLVAFTASTLAGPYGLLLTNLHLRSKDIGEDPSQTPRNLVELDAVRVSEENKYQLIVAPGQVHELPTHLEDRETAALASLVREWASNRVN